MLEGGAMMGKDYMLAILIVNYDDNIWTDQNLQLDPELPPGWRTIRDSAGTYYWHVPSGDTQWTHPRTSPAQVSWHEDFLSNDPSSKCFSVRSLGWLEVQEDDLSPGRSSLAVSHVIQQLSRCSSPEQRDRQGAWGEGREMMLVLKKDTLSLLDPLDHNPPSLVTCSDATLARTIASALHEMCSKMMSDQTLMRPSRSLTMDNISPEDLPRQVEFLEAVRQQEQKFDVQYIGNLPVSRAMGMEVLNRAIESILNATDREEWEPAVIHVTDHILSLWRGEEGEEPLWECQVRLLTFLGVGHDCHTFAVICDGGAQRFEAHVFWSEPDAGQLSEAVQAACMVYYLSLPVHRYIISHFLCTGVLPLTSCAQVYYLSLPVHRYIISHFLCTGVLSLTSCAQVYYLSLPVHRYIISHFLCTGAVSEVFGGADPPPEDEVVERDPKGQEEELPPPPPPSPPPPSPQQEGDEGIPPDVQETSRLLIVDGGRATGGRGGASGDPSPCWSQRVINSCVWLA
ncbi:hypothetical protein NQZ68_033172 [Dissostichus eleginoides]|nr:hypothetical protein NQZ68_033172 [Dissostichus eleginoides]